MSEQMPQAEQDDRSSASAAIDRAGSAADISAKIEEIGAGEAARVLRELPVGKAAEVAQYLDPNTAATILARVDTDRAAEIFALIEVTDAGLILAAMNPDDRVDLLGHLPKDLHDSLLAELEAGDRADVKHLEQFAPDSAGGIMTTQVTALYEYITVENAISLLRRLNEELEQMFYVYVINRRGQLVGVLSMRDLILAKPEAQLHTIMIKNVRSVPATMDQEQVARIMRNYGYLAVPVVDKDNALVGLITLDDVVEVIQEEATEDIQRMFGAGAEERLNSSWFFSFRKRVGWLEVNLGTAFMAAAIVSLFDKTISAVPILAAYQTVVSGMGGNAGAQAMAVAIRGIAMGEIDSSTLRKALWRQFLVGLASGVVIGITTGTVAAIFNFHNHGIVLGFVVCFALMLNHVNACVTGVAIPFIMKRMGFDPAQSSSIIATTFTDCGGFFACLGLASLLMKWLT